MRGYGNKIGRSLRPISLMIFESLEGPSHSILNFISGSFHYSGLLDIAYVFVLLPRLLMIRRDQDGY